MTFNLIISLCLIFCTFSNVFSIETNYTQQLSSRVVKGKTDTINSFPWYASLHVTYLNNANVNYCGGSIISNNFILTSAECIYNAKSIKINVGSTSFSKPAKTITSTTFYINPKFNLQTYQNNIALIKLPTALLFTTTMRPIRLITKSQINELFLNSETYFAGFGYTASHTMSETITWAKQRVISNQECLHHYSSQIVQTGEVCTIGWDNPLKAICFGDGGGPLTINEYGTWTQIAVMSFIHANGCQSARPTGFTRIAPHINWITSQAGYVFRE